MNDRKASQAAGPSASELTELYDRMRIEEVVVGFEVAHDSTDQKQLYDLLAPDAQIVENGKVLMSGRDTIAPHIIADQQRLNPGIADREYGTLRHFLTNIQISVKGDSTATANAYCIVTGYNKTAKRPEIVSVGEYAEELVKLDGRWKLRKVVINIEQGNEGMARELELGPFNPSFKHLFQT